MKLEMTQLYLCEEPYWSKYDQSDLSDHPLEINVISDGKYYARKMCTSEVQISFDYIFWFNKLYPVGNLLQNVYLCTMITIIL